VNKEETNMVIQTQMITNQSEGKMMNEMTKLNEISLESFRHFNKNVISKSNKIKENSDRMNGLYNKSEERVSSHNSIMITLFKNER
jgi:hypothetical protein